MQQAAAPPPEPGSTALHRPRWGKRLRYASTAAALALSIAFIESLVARPEVPAPTRVSDDGERVMAILTTAYGIVGAPVVETAIMAVVLHWVRRWVPAVVAMLICATTLTCLHRLGGGINWYVLPSFVVLSYVYLDRQKPPNEDAFTVTAMAHALVNATLTILAALFGDTA